MRKDFFIEKSRCIIEFHRKYNCRRKNICCGEKKKKKEKRNQIGKNIYSLLLPFALSVSCYMKLHLYKRVTGI